MTLALAPDDYDIAPAADNAAEVAVLAACLQSTIARKEARKTLTGADFHQPHHEQVWDAMARLDHHKKHVDAQTLNAVLKPGSRAHRLLPDLVTTFADPDGIRDYAAIVRGWAVKRRLYSEAIRVQQQALSPEVSANGYAASVVNRFAAIRDAGTAADDVEALLLDELMDLPDPAYEWVIPGLLERGDRLIVTGEEGLGKALAIDTPIPTPKGLTTMASLAPGDEVFGPDGKPTRVVAATGIMRGRPCYRVKFSDGSAMIADENHIWETRDYKARQPRAFAERTAPLQPRGTDQRSKRAGYAPALRTTKELAETLKARGGHTLNHSIDTCEPVQYPTQELPIPPYALGAWLGDGTSAAANLTIHPDDHEILDRIRDEGWPVRKLKAPYAWGIGDGLGKGVRGDGTFAGRLRRLGIFGKKHIPEMYLRASVEQRLALLQGLMDTDGTISTGAAPIAEFSVTSAVLALDVRDLLLGLGIKVGWAQGPAKINGRTVGTRYRLAFQTHLPVFHLRRKAERVTAPRTDRYRRRYVVSVDRVQTVPVRCIQVDRADGMFLAGQECIPTHNSSLLRQIAVMAAAGLHPFSLKRIEPVRALIYDSENTRRQFIRNARGLHTFACMEGENPGPRVMVENTGRIDITRDRDLAKIHSLCDAMQPDVLVIGPLYRLVPHAINGDDEAVPVLAALDTLKDRGIALLIEAHAGKSVLEHGGGRNMAPRGSSALLGWPEFGYGMRRLDGQATDSVCEFLPWRGARDERAWPMRMRRASHMTWTETI